MIMLCVSTVSYKVALNGREIGPIVPHRGLRQRDPLSLHICSSFVQKDYLLLSEMQREKKIFMGVRYVVGLPVCLICSS